MQWMIDWFDEWFLQPVGGRLRTWLSDPSDFTRAVGRGLMAIVTTAALIGIALFLLWIDQYWSEGWVGDLLEAIGLGDLADWLAL